MGLQRGCFGVRLPIFLIHPDGEPADPGVFNTAVPDWKAGDTFLAGSDLRRCRILDVNTEDPPAASHGVFTVEPVD